MRLVLEINLGNAAMQTGRDVADALGQVVHRVEDNLLPLRSGDGGTIHDANGNATGTWTVEP